MSLSSSLHPLPSYLMQSIGLSYAALGMSHSFLTCAPDSRCLDFENTMPYTNFQSDDERGSVLKIFSSYTLRDQDSAFFDPVYVGTHIAFLVSRDSAHKILSRVRTISRPFALEFTRIKYYRHMYAPFTISFHRSLTHDI